MPRHLISGAHEWINEVPTVPIYYLAKPQPRERTWENQRGKKTLLSLTLVSYVQARVNGGSNYDSLKVAKCLVIQLVTRMNGLARFLLSQSIV